MLFRISLFANFLFLFTQVISQVISKDEMGLFAVFALPLCVVALKGAPEKVEVLFEVQFTFKAGQLSRTDSSVEIFSLSK